MAEVASAYVSLMPSAKGFGRAIDQQIGGDLDLAGRRGGQQYGNGFSKGPSGGGFGGIGKTVGIGLAVGIGVGLVGALAKTFAFVKDAAIDGIAKASDLNETVSKAGQIFGDAADDVVAFAKTSVRSLGQTRQQAIDAAATFGVFGKSAGLAGKPLADFSTRMVSLASDMASFSNTDVDTAIGAIGAAMRGEAEPIRQFGVLLDDATLRNEALKLGLIETTKEALTPQQRVLAAQSAILAQTADAQGDFARTGDGLANSQKKLTAAWDEAKTRLGTALLPTMTTFTNLLVEKGVPALEKMTDWLDQNKVAIGDLGITVGQVGIGVIEMMLRMGSGFAGFHAVVSDVGASVLTGMTIMAKGILDAGLLAFGWIPGVGDKLAKSRIAIEGFGTVGTEVLRREADNSRGLSDWLSSAADKAAGLRHELETFKPSYSTKMILELGTRGVTSKDGLLIPRASGGPVWPGQPFLVGESGPELVTFPSNGTVHDAGATAAALGTGGGGEVRLSQASVWQIAHALSQVTLAVNGQVISGQVGRTMTQAGAR